MTLSAFLREYVAEPIAALSPKCKTLGMTVSYVLFGWWFGGTPNYLLLGVFLAAAILLEDGLIRKAPKALRRTLGIVGMAVIFFLMSFASLPRLWLGLRGLVGLNPGGFFQKAALLPALHALPLILLSICFCMPLGQMLRSFCNGHFQEESGVRKAAAVFETIYPIGLLILTGVLLLTGGTATFLTL